MNKTILVIPCFNEESRIKSEEFIHSLTIRPDLNWLFVNDGSTDGTLDTLRALQKGHEDRIHIHNLEKNKGKGEAVRQGLLKAIQLGARVTGFFDADLATPMTEVIRLVELINTRPEQVVLGSRVFLLGHRIKRTRWRFLLGRAYAKVTSFLLRTSVHDTQCGAKVIVNFKGLADCLQKPFLSDWLFDVELINRMIHTGNLTVDDFFEEPLLEWTDVVGSKLNVGFLATSLWDLLKIIVLLKR
jgi:glycosyltransferase involved in cell wall biosynthesis